MHRLRTLPALAVTAFTATVALPVLGAGVASATESEGCQSATVQYRIVGADGNVVGADWTSQGGLYLWKTAPGTVEVRLAAGQTVGDGCKYPVSLAEYTTEGPDWYSSGRQTLADKATVYLTSADVAGKDDSGRTWQKLSVKTPDCYGQIDLYGDDVTYDGGTGEGHGPAPYEPDGVVTPYHLIAAWNGGEKPCTPKTPESPTPTPSEPTASTPATPTTPADNPPPTGESTPPTTHKPPTKPPTTPDVPPLESTPPTTPKPTPSDSTPPLAETGSSTPVGPIVGGAALVIAVGAAAVFATRRTRRS
ncbi:LAETG motif-containing sortase-dependent surface protein [Streptomyces sp. NPDC001137]|uniref:LAETG motif-containing sortase-dependent surface protein n=1 Tax=Streptomyces sp. NPDC001137 TaxID=3154378 RepID=UPI0033348FBC